MMEHDILKTNITANSPTIPDESVTCMAVKEHRHQNIMSSAVLKRNRRTWSKRESGKIHQLVGVQRDHVEKRDLAVIAFRNRVAENCNAEVTLEDAVKGDKPSNGLVENAVMLLRGVIRTMKCLVECCTQEELRKDSPVLQCMVAHAGSILSRCQKGRDGRTPFERLHGKRPTQNFVPFGKVLARPISSKPLNRMNPRYKFGVWLGVRNNSAECFVRTAEGVFRAREVRRMEHQDRWDKEAINNVIGVPWRNAHGNRIVDRPATQTDPLPPPPVPYEEVRVQMERITRTEIETFGTTAGCPGCNAIRSGKSAQAHSDLCRARIEECLKITLEGASRPDRRSEVLNEALAKGS